MVNILGKDYELKFTLWAREQLSKIYGTYKLQELMEADNDIELYKRIIGIARVLIQAANLRAKLNLDAFLDEKDLPEEDCWLFMEDHELGDVLGAITKAYTDAYKMSIKTEPDPKAKATQ